MKHLPFLFCALASLAAAAPVAPDLLHGVAVVEATGQADEVSLSRVPQDVLAALNANARLRARSPAGAEVRVNLKGDAVKLALRIVEDRSPRTRGRPVLAEVRYGDHLLCTHVIGSEWTTIEVPRPPAKLPEHRVGEGFDPQLIRVVLPYAVEVRLGSIVGDVSPARKEQVPATRYLAYGSSITHGYDCARPGETYPALLARRRGWDAINLGFGAGAHLEPAMAKWIAERDDWDVATLELGVNLLGGIDEAEFRRRVRHFLRTIAEARPQKWVFVIDIFRSGRDLSGHAKQAAFRRVVRECVEEIASPRLVHLDGLELLHDLGGLSPDLLHPSSDGFHEIARRLEAAILPHLSPSATPSSPPTS